MRIVLTLINNIVLCGDVIAAIAIIHTYFPKVISAGLSILHPKIRRVFAVLSFYQYSRVVTKIFIIGNFTTQIVRNIYDEPIRNLNLHGIWLDYVL